MREKPDIEELKKIRRRYYAERKKEIREKRAKGIKVDMSYKTAKPWYRHWDAAHTRCTNPKAINYKTYGAKGVKFELTPEEIKYLWILDEAIHMERPSLDRVDSSKGYTFENCRFIELSENSARANRGKKRKKENG